MIMKRARSCGGLFVYPDLSGFPVRRPVFYSHRLKIGKCSCHFAKNGQWLSNSGHHGAESDSHWPKIEKCAAHFAKKGQWLSNSDHHAAESDSHWLKIEKCTALFAKNGRWLTKSHSGAASAPGSGRPAGRQTPRLSRAGRARRGRGGPGCGGRGLPCRRAL